jgi:hypothetical protein
MKRFLLSVIIVFLSVQLYAQPDSSAAAMLRFVQNIQTFNRLYPQEKVYLHFDNTGYYLGEIIWFKAYVVDAGSLQPDVKSGVLYVELLNPLGEVLDSRKLKIKDGQCHGEFQLSSINMEYLAGFYEIRAYTKWMLNFGTETIFSRVFPVFNSPEKDGDYGNADMENDLRRQNIQFQNHRKKPKSRKKLNLDFYPEGGNLINGSTCRVAFKATDEKGQGVDVIGEIQNLQGETQTSFSSQYKGMGSFEYTPNENRSKVKITHQGKDYTFDLPKSIPDGYLLKVNNMLSTNLIIRIEKNINRPDIPLGLSVMCRGQAVFFQTLQTLSETPVLQIPKEALPAGVNRITLFDAKGEIYAERSVFIHSKQKKQLDSIGIMPDKEEYGERERITIHFSTRSRDASFSLAVRDLNHLVATPDAGNIQTNLLLSSDLNGYIENPSWYFEQNNAERRNALDLLMLVQGWKRYQWQQMAGINLFNPDYDLETGLKIKGKVAGKAKTVNIEIDLNDGNYLIDTVRTDDSGNFTTKIEEDLLGTYNLLLSAPELKKANLNIRLDRWFSPAPKTYHPIETLLSTVILSDKTEITEEEESKDHLNSNSMNRPIELHSVEVNVKRGKDIIYNVEKDYERWVDLGIDNSKTVVFDYLVEKNNGFVFESNDTKVPFDNSWFTSKGGYLCFGTYMAYIGYMEKGRIKYRDGRMHDADDLLTIERDINEVQKITASFGKKEIAKWINEKPKYKYRVPLVVYPYEISNIKNRKDLRYTFFEGYSKVKDFYQDTPLRENYIPNKSEYTRTLYWNPNVRMDENGRAIVSFYNNAHCRKIDISAEGITKDGIIISN